MNLSADIQGILIEPNSTILTSLKKMDEVKGKLLIVFEHGKYLGLLSIGDIQRAIINNVDLNSSISEIVRKDYITVKPQHTIDEVKKIMISIRAEFMPVVNVQNELVDVYFWKDIFGEVERKKETFLNLPVVIMAGGKGTRLQPLTNVIPKPLIPIGAKTILEEIMDRFVSVGCFRFYISVNYKAATIKHYLSELNNETYDISYFQEDKPLGTAGSMYLLKNKLSSTFFVSNCDIIIDQDLEDIYEYHKRNKNDITIVSALKHHVIPYGTIEIEKNGILKKLHEKPEVTYQINTGVYILEPHVLNNIPEDKFYHITHLIEDIKENKGKVGVFPISEGAWQDMGEWDEYKKVLANNGFTI